MAKTSIVPNVLFIKQIHVVIWKIYIELYTYYDNRGIHNTNTQPQDQATRILCDNLLPSPLSLPSFSFLLSDSSSLSVPYPSPQTAPPPCGHVCICNTISLSSVVCGVSNKQVSCPPSVMLPCCLSRE